MSRSQLQALDAIASQLLVAVEQYEEDVSNLSLQWRADENMEDYLRVSQSMDNLRSMCAARPELSVQWVALLVSHTELMHTLWRVSQGAKGVDLSQHLGEHRACVQAMASRCRRLLA